MIAQISPTVWNVLCSAAGGFAVLVAIWMWKEVVPRIASRLRRDEPRLPTNWKTAFSEGGTQYTETVTLRQRGRHVSGQITLRTSDSEISTYEFEGRFKWLLLTATYASIDPGEVEQGAFALQFKRGKLVGQYILYSKQSEHLISSAYTWEPLD